MDTTPSSIPDLPDLPPPPADLADLPDAPPDVPELPDEGPQEAQQALVRVPDEVLEPEALIPSERVLTHLQGITAADIAEAVMLSERALAIKAIADDATEERAGALIDECTAKKTALEGKVNPFARIADRLHKALTGFRGSATGPLDRGLEHLRPMLAKRIREKQEAERKRQLEQQEAALKAERERLAKEAADREAEAKRLAAAAEQTSDPVVQEQLQAESSRATAEADRARFDAATVAPPPVVAQPVTTVAGAGTRDNWKCYPEHGNDLSSMVPADRKALILHVAARIQAGDDSLVNLLAVDSKVANQLAKAQKATLRIPGLRAFNDIAFTKRRG